MVTWKHQSILEPAASGRDEFIRDRGLNATKATPLIAFREPTWQSLTSHVQSASIELGGVLVGEVFQDSLTHQALIDVHHAIPAMGAYGSSTYFKMTPEAWDHISRVRDRDCPDLVTVGWYHSHPGLGVFYSETDRASQKAFFARPWNFGIVVDPATNEYGLFLGAESSRLHSNHLVFYTPVEQKSESHDQKNPSFGDLEERYVPSQDSVERDGQSRDSWLLIGGASAGALLLCGALWLSRRRRP